MGTRRVVLDVDSPGQEALLRQFHAYLVEMQELALRAPEGQVLDQCEAAVLSKGREVQRAVLQNAVEGRIQVAEKKGRH